MKKNGFTCRLYNRKLNALLAALLTALSPVYAGDENFSANEVNLSKTRLGWGTVLTGKVISQPVRTSRGFVAPHEGNGLTAFSENGKILWQTAFPEGISPYLTATHGDMLYLVTGGTKLSLLQNDGKKAWTKDSGFVITESPMPGRDGRVFARGKDEIACFGTKGTIRWKKIIKEQNEDIPLSQLDKGSVFLFASDGAYTVSPFGEIRGPFKTDFQVEHADTTDFGALVTFSDGSISLFTENDGVPRQKWMLPGDGKKTHLITRGFDRGKAAILSDGKITLIRTDTGKTITSFPVHGSPATLKHAERTTQGIILISGKNAACYTDTGLIEWSADFPDKKKWTHIIPSDQGFLIFCTTGWTLEAYRVKQLPATQGLTSFSTPEPGLYSELYGTTDKVSSISQGRAVNESLSAEMKKAFSEGGFGQKEKDWLPLLTNEMNAIGTAWNQSIAQTQTELPYFATHTDYAKEVVELAASTETLAFQKPLSLLIRRNKNPRRLECLVKAAGIIAWDPGYLMMTELGKVAEKFNENDELLELVCDATLEICRFMGKEAFVEKGRGILTAMISLKYSRAIREYARVTMEKILNFQ